MDSSVLSSCSLAGAREVAGSRFTKGGLLSLPILRPHVKGTARNPPAFGLARVACRSEFNPKNQANLSTRLFRSCTNTRNKWVETNRTRMHATYGEDQPPAGYNGHNQNSRYVGVPLDYYYVLGLERNATAAVIEAMHAKVLSDENETIYGIDMKISRSRLLAHILHELSIPETKAAYDQKLDESKVWPTVQIQLECLPGALALMLEVRICRRVVDSRLPSEQSHNHLAIGRRTLLKRLSVSVKPARLQTHSI
eukprot:5007744-Pyramimonas_sp.AAC.3